MNGKRVSKSWAPTNWQFLRFETLERDNFICQYCGRRPPDVKLQAGHIIPRCDGGKDEIRNLVTACADCNAGKWGRSLVKISPTLAIILSATERRKNALKRTLQAIERNEKECYQMEREIAKTAAGLPKTAAQMPKRSGVIVTQKAEKKTRKV